MAKKSKNRIVTYFEQKDMLRPIALGALIAGLVMMWLGRSYISYILAAILISVGLVTYIVTAARIVSHDEVPDQAKKAMREYDAVYTESKEFSKEVLRHPAPVESELHIYGDGAKYFKKVKDGRVISDVYVKSHFFFTNESFVAVSRRVSLCELDGLTKAGIYDEFKKLAFSDISSASLEEKELEVILSDTKKPVKVKQGELVILGKGGELLRLAVKNDVAMESLCKDVSRRCASGE